MEKLTLSVGNPHFAERPTFSNEKHSFSQKNPLYQSTNRKSGFVGEKPGFSNSSAFLRPYTVQVKISTNKTVKKPCVIVLQKSEIGNKQ